MDKKMKYKKFDQTKTCGHISGFLTGGGTDRPDSEIGQVSNISFASHFHRVRQRRVTAAPRSPELMVPL